MRGRWTVLAGFVLRRVGLLLVALVAIFAAADLLPGSAIRGLLGTDASPDQVRAHEHRLGLDRPFPERLVRWLGNLVAGDLGHTLRGEKVADLVVGRVGYTLALTGLALVATTVIAVAGGAWWAQHPGGRFARIAGPLTSAMVSIPEFVVGSLLVVVFALVLNVLPAVTVVNFDGGLQHPDMLVLPVATLALAHASWNMRVVRAAVGEADQLPHVAQARLDGLAGWAVMWRHVFPLAAPAVAASLSATIGMLVGGAVVVEALFNFPGLGTLLVGAVTNRDTVLVASVAAVTAVMIMVLLATADGVRWWALRGRR